MEVWRDIPGYEGLYQVSSFGRVKSLKRKANTYFGKRTVPERILKEYLDNYGYPIVRLYKNKKPKTMTVHRIVAKAFIENPSERPAVNHIDGTKTNNNYENIEWVTNKENTQHGIKNGLIGSMGESNHNSKLTAKDVRHIRDEFDRGISRKTLSKGYRVNYQTIARIIKRSLWANV